MPRACAFRDAALACNSRSTSESKLELILSFCASAVRRSSEADVKGFIMPFLHASAAFCLLTRHPITFLCITVFHDAGSMTGLALLYIRLIWYMAMFC